MRIQSFAIAAAFLAGCATAPPPEIDYSATRASWQGVPYDAVVAQWGQPGRYTVMDDGRYVYSWYSQTGGGGGGVAYPSTTIGVFGGSRGGGVGVSTGIGLPGMGMGGSGEVVRCERTFVFKNAVVVEQTWNGNSQFCSTFVRR